MEIYQTQVQSKLPALNKCFQTMQAGDDLAVESVTPKVYRRPRCGVCDSQTIQAGQSLAVESVYDSQTVQAGADLVVESVTPKLNRLDIALLWNL